MMRSRSGMASRAPLLLALVGLLFGGSACAIRGTVPPASMALAGGDSEDSEEDDSAAEGAVSTLGAIILYIPNRIFDLAEIVRFGVNVGPGIGIDAQVTKYAQATVMSRVSVGVGYQGLRKLPVSAATETAVAAGPVRPDASVGIQWPREDGDIRVEPHLLLVGAHVAVDAFAIGDFLAGILGFDPSGDDFGF